MTKHKHEGWEKIYKWIKRGEGFRVEVHRYRDETWHVSAFIYLRNPYFRKIKSDDIDQPAIKAPLLHGECIFLNTREFCKEVSYLYQKNEIPPEEHENKIFEDAEKLFNFLFSFK